MRTVRKKAKHLLAAILTLALVASGSALFVHAEGEQEDGYVYYNQVFNEFMNLSTIADAGLTKVGSSQMPGYNPIINGNGYLYADARHPNGGDQNGYPDILLPDVLPSDEKNYTLEVDFRWANAVVESGQQGKFWSLTGGFDFGFNYYGANGGKKADAHLKYWESGKGRFDKFGGTSAVKKEILDAWAITNIPDRNVYPSPAPTESGAGRWVSVKIAVVDGKLSKATVTVDGVPEATQDFNAQAVYEISPGGRVYFKHCGTDFEVKQVRIVKGNYHEYTEYSGEQAEKSYSEVVMGIVPDEIPEPEKTIVARAYQTSAHENDLLNVRIIFGLESLEYDKYGFEVTRNSDTENKVTKEGNTVWTSVNGYEEGALRVWTAAEIGATYLCAITLVDVPTTGTYTFEVDSYTITGSAAEYGVTFIITVENGMVIIPDGGE